MRRVRRLTTAGLATLGVLAGLLVSTAPALASEGYGVTGVFGRSGSGEGELSLASADNENDIALSSAGDVYVVDTGNNRVEYFSSTGIYLGQFDGSAAPGGKFSKPEGVAIDDSGKTASEDPSVGDVYVADHSQGVIDKFSATGEFLFQLNGSFRGVAVDQSGDVWAVNEGITETHLEEFSNAAKNVRLASPSLEAEFVGGITTDSEDNPYLITRCSVEKFSKAGGAGLGSIGNTGCATGVEIDPTTNDLYIDEETLIAQYGAFGEPFGAPVHVSKPNSLVKGSGVAVNPVSHEVYAADSASDDVKIFTLGPTPDATKAFPATEVKAESATLHGKLKLAVGETKLEYYFEYNTGASCAGGSKTPVKFTEDEGEVSETVTGLEPGVEYTYCLVAGNTFGLTPGNQESFPTPAAAPAIISESASNMEKKEGRFAAVINPEHSAQETTCSFEYSTEGSTEHDTLAGEIETVACESATPSGYPIAPEVFEPVTVSSAEVHLSEIAGTYYYRVAATNGTGTEKGKVEAYTKLPTITDEKLSGLSSSSVKLQAAINPEFRETTYRFEYSTSKEELELGKGSLVPGGSGAIGENEKAFLAYCHNETLPTPEGGSFSCDDGSQPKCEDGATPTPHSESLLCPFPVVSVEVFFLQPGQTYYYRVVVVNEETENAENANEGKPVVSEVIKEFTPYAVPIPTTGAAQSVTGATAALAGEVNPEGAETTYYFAYISEAGYQEALKNGAANPAGSHYQEELAKGVPSPYAEGQTTAPLGVGSSSTEATDVGPVIAGGLRPAETYHYALVATNKFGARGTGGDESFTTPAGTPPLVSTGGASGVSQNAATLSGTVTTNGLQTNYGFEIATEPFQPGTHVPATGLGSIGGAATEEVHVTLGELQPGTTYFYRVEATSADGTVQGAPASFTTPGFPTLLTGPSSTPLIAVPNIAFPKEEKTTSGTTTKTLTNKEKLAKALKVCKRDHSKTKRQSCEKAARKKYSAASKKKAKGKKK